MSGGNTEESVLVVVRCRPMNKNEIEGGYTQIVSIRLDEGLVEIRDPKSALTDPSRSFVFDKVFDCNSKQATLYEQSFAPLVESVLNGFNGTIFAYGQTGTGKTYTMEGDKDNPVERGLIPRSFEHIYSHISGCGKDHQFLVRASYLEIYQESIRDLLAKDQDVRLELKERPDTGIYVKDLSSFVCKSQSEIEHVMKVGNQNRSVGATQMNAHSSRSHAIFMVTVECSEVVGVSDDNQHHIRVGKLNLVDLAGSERQSKTGTSGKRFKEATMINLSLSTLGKVISALVDPKVDHIPYRDSKLTRLLQSSLGGNAKTVMVANIGPACFNYDESISTLRYANRAKNIKNKPRINEDPKDALLREFQEEIARLKARLNSKIGTSNTEKRKKSETNGKNQPFVDSSSNMYDMNLNRRLSIERELLENDTSLLSEEKSKLMMSIAEKESTLADEISQRKLIMTKIEAMESKLLRGEGPCMVTRTNEQQRRLEEQRRDLAERQRQHQVVADRLEVSLEMGQEMDRTYSSLQAEVETKTKRLKKVYAKLQAVKQVILNVTEEYNRDRRDLEATQETLIKELKFKTILIDNFIPCAEKDQVVGRAIYDEEKQTWRISAPVCPLNSHSVEISRRPVSSFGSRQPVSSFGSRRPVTAYARRQSNRPILGTHNENLMKISLDMPVRTTRDYEGPKVAPRVQAVLDAALRINIEPDVVLDATRVTKRRDFNSIKSTVLRKRGSMNHK